MCISTHKSIFFLSEASPTVPFDQVKLHLQYNYFSFGTCTYIYSFITETLKILFLLIQSKYEAHKVNPLLPKWITQVCSLNCCGNIISPNFSLNNIISSFWKWLISSCFFLILLSKDNPILLSRLLFISPHLLWATYSCC